MATGHGPLRSRFCVFPLDFSCPVIFPRRRTDTTCIHKCWADFWLLHPEGLISLGLYGICLYLDRRYAHTLDSFARYCTVLGQVAELTQKHWACRSKIGSLNASLYAQAQQPPERNETTALPRMRCNLPKLSVSLHPSTPFRPVAVLGTPPVSFNAKRQSCMLVWDLQTWAWIPLFLLGVGSAAGAGAAGAARAVASAHVDGLVWVWFGLFRTGRSLCVCFFCFCLLRDGARKGRGGKRREGFRVVFIYLRGPPLFRWRQEGVQLT